MSTPPTETQLWSLSRFEGLIVVETAFSLSLFAVAAAVSLVGSSPNLDTDRRWQVAGSEMLAVGMVAAGIAFGVGSLLGGLA